MTPVGPVTYVEHLQGAAVDPATIELFLDPGRPSWAQFDPVTGYRLADSLTNDGMHGTATISTCDASGARTMQMHRDKPCRIATYGDSFTQCAQVSDGETWQEYLAAHIGEPIRNFGVGGFGVYQAYRRMCQMEEREDGVEYVIFYVWGDDHIRSLLRCRHPTIYPVYDNSGHAFHANFWASVEMDLDTGRLQERENLLPTPEAVRRMSDADWMVESLRDDLAIQMSVYAHGWTSDLDMGAVRRLADRLEMGGQALTDSRPAREVVQQLLDRYAFAATELILGRAREFAEQRGKKLLVCLNDTVRVMRELVEGRPRHDQPIVAFLQEHEFLTFDMNPVHLEDYASFAITFEEYVERYLIGHYNPAGNHLFAYSLMPTLVNWLDPKPITHAATSERSPTYEGYLRRGRSVAD